MRNLNFDAFALAHSLRACLKTRPVRGPGLQDWLDLVVSCRPRALTRQGGGVFKQALKKKRRRRHGARTFSSALHCGILERPRLASLADKNGRAPWGDESGVIKSR